MKSNSKSATALLSSIAPDGMCVGRGKTSPETESPLLECERDTLVEKLRRRLFNRFALLRSTPFRIGAVFWLLFTVCFGVAEYFIYTTIEERVLGHIEESITQRFDQLTKINATRGFDEVIRIVESGSRVSPMKSSMGYHISSIDGSRIAGNVPLCTTQPGWGVLTGESLGLKGDQGHYRFYTGNVGGNIISLGKSLDELVAMRKVALSCLIWAAVVSMLLAIAAAWYFAQRIHNRMSGISVALDGVGAGNLNARLPVSCAGDDIDHFAMKINSSLDRLRQTVDGMRQVSTDIAHDLKTPLNRLYMTIDDAAEKSRSGECVGDALDGALEEAQAINATFEALLRIAQIEAGARKSQFKHFDLSGVLETAAEVYSPVVEEQNQKLIINFDARQSLRMLGDKSLVLQLVVNLIENAVHHCSENTLITLSAGEEVVEGKSVVWLSVSDTGEGIPDVEREKVFQRLYRLERSRTSKGTGLGLSLVKAIAELHNGDISLNDNSPGLVVMVRFDRNEPEII